MPLPPSSALIRCPGYRGGLAPWQFDRIYDPRRQRHISSGHPQYKNLALRRRPNPRSHLKDPRHHASYNLEWNIEYATAFLVNHLDPTNSPQVTEALCEIRSKAKRLWHSTSQKRDIAYLHFTDLDRVLFNSTLRDAVYLNVAELGTEVSGVTYSPRQGHMAVPRISIFLNTQMYAGASSDDILANLVHQMIHAYFLVACGEPSPEEGGYGRLSHGKPFAKIVSTIRKMSISDTMPLLPISVSHKLTSRVPLHRRQRNHIHSRLQQEQWNMSYCWAGVGHISKADVEEWYEAHCKPLPDLPECAQKAKISIFHDGKLAEVRRAAPQAVPTEDAVELLWEDIAVQIPRDKIKDYESVEKVFEKSRWLEMPEDTPKETLMSLVEFISTGSYAPDITPVMAPHQRGPPIIRPVKDDWPQFLLTDIRLLKLAVELKMDEVKEAALGRMRRQYYTHEDPITIFREIYDPKAPEPDPALRTWAKSFLKRQPDPRMLMPGDLEYSHISMGPNIFKLEHDPTFQRRFGELLEESSSFTVDVSKVHQYLGQAQHAGLQPVLDPPSRVPSPIDGGMAAGMWGVPPFYPAPSVLPFPPRVGSPDIDAFPPLGFMNPYHMGWGGHDLDDDADETDPLYMGAIPPAMPPGMPPGMPYAWPYCGEGAQFGDHL